MRDGKFEKRFVGECPCLLDAPFSKRFFSHERRTFVVTEYTRKYFRSTRRVLIDENDGKLEALVIDPNSE